MLANSNSDRVSVPLEKAADEKFQAADEKAADEKAAETLETTGERSGSGGNCDRVSVPLEKAAETLETTGEPRGKGGGRPFRDAGKYIEAGIYVYIYTYIIY